MLQQLELAGSKRAYGDVHAGAGGVARRMAGFWECVLLHAHVCGGADTVAYSTVINILNS